MNVLRRIQGRLIVGLSLVLLLFVLPSLAEAGSERSELPSQEVFDVDAISVKGTVDHRSRVDLYARVPYTSLNFLSRGDEFTADYTMSVEIHRLGVSDDPQYVAERSTWDRTATAQNYASTRSSQRFDRSSISVELRPGRYLVVYQMEDAAGYEVHEKTLPITVRDYSGAVSVSDVLLLDNYDAVSSTITPRATRQLSTSDRNLSFFYEIYADEPQNVRVRRQLVRTERSGGLPVLGSILRLGRDEEVSEGEITYTQVDTRRIEAGRTPMAVTMPLEDAGVGEYVLRIRVEDERAQVIDEVEKALFLRWRGLMAHIRNLDEAIDQLRYVAKDREIEHIRAGSTEQERMERFQAFWERRDPTPGAERNERMEEYYYRVARANRIYSSERGGQEQIAGWETDRGHVMVRYGEPDRVERRPYSADRNPYEIWHYERIGRQFVFVGDGQGTFQLVEPSWNEPSRIR